MFHLHDLRKTRVWQEAVEEGREETRQDFVQKLLSNGMSIKEISALLEIPLPEVRRLAKKGKDEGQP